MANAFLLDLLHAAPMRLAPMASYTNLPFRRVAVECGSGFVTNEEIDADALVRGRPGAEQMARIEPDEGPVAMQLLGCDASTLVPAAKRLVDLGASVIDLNMGCPAPKVVRRGKGAALMRDVEATGRILEALRAAVDVPLTVKIRGGWDDEHTNAVEVARMAEAVGVDAITVHPRTRMQRFGGKAPWELIADVVEAVEVPVTGNGDVTSLAEARRMMAETGCVSVMVGRGALGRPWMFDEAYETLSALQRLEYEQRVIRRHFELIEAEWDRRDALVQMQKHLSLYLTGKPGARTSRVELFSQREIASIRAIFERAFEGAAAALEALDEREAVEARG
jgi:nifR3 family TIM-barrel protein